MQTPAQIDFQDFTPTAQQKAAIHERLAAVERMFGRIVAGRIVVKGSSLHHRTGGLTKINIRLTLPGGREVDVSHTPGADERQANFDFALGDSFRRAERQLRDHVERMQGEVKHRIKAQE